MLYDDAVEERLRDYTGNPTERTRDLWFVALHDFYREEANEYLTEQADFVEASIGLASDELSAQYQVFLPKLAERRADPPIPAQFRPPLKPPCEHRRDASELPHLTDTGNAIRFVGLHSTQLRYVDAWGRWLIWDGVRWVSNQSKIIHFKAREVAMQLHVEAATMPLNETNKGAREGTSRWAFASESNQRIQSMLTLAATDPIVARIPDQFDADPWKLGVQNGVVNLQTGELEQPDPESLITKQCNCSFDATATCPMWMDFLNKATDGDAETIDFLQKVAGYTLTADTGEQCFFLIHGPAGTGKTVFTGTIQYLLGDYALEVDPATLMEAGRNRRAGHQASPDIARLFGVRMSVAAETTDGAHLAESLLKHLTGGDKISARFLHCNNFDFTPTCKIFIYTNHLPKVTSPDDAIWRRIRKITFSHSFLGKGRNKNFGKLLKKTELPGILNWMIEGLLAWQKDGLPLPEKIEKDTAEYRKNEDQIARFLEDCVEVKKGMQIEAGKLYKAYKGWSAEQGEFCKSQTRFGKALMERGFEKDRIGVPQRAVYLGLSLVFSHEDVPPEEEGFL